MTNRKEQDNEIIHRLLDDDLTAEEKKVLLDRIETDPALRAELEAVTGALRLVETSAKMQAPAFFTAEVMAKLPPKKAPFGQRIRDFFFQGRVLRWNMATAFATAAVVALVLSLAVRTPKPPVQTAAVPSPEQTVMVTMRLHAPEAHRVAVAGSFNKWDDDSHMLTKQANGIWTISIPLKPGEYNYMFIVDGKAWVADPDAETYRDDGFGNRNAVMRVRT